MKNIYYHLYLLSSHHIYEETKTSCNMERDDSLWLYSSSVCLCSLKIYKIDAFDFQHKLLIVGETNESEDQLEAAFSFLNVQTERLKDEQ